MRQPRRKRYSATARSMRRSISWRYMWRATALHRSEATGELAADGPPQLPDGIRRNKILHPAAGAGPLFHRVYRARIREARLGPRELVAKHHRRSRPGGAERVCAPPQGRRRGGNDGRSATSTSSACPGRGTGPCAWSSARRARFRFVTLDGHLEAGQIRFAAERGDLLEFRIESWARAGDRLSNLLYHHLRMSKRSSCTYGPRCSNAWRSWPAGA
jgi:hypothetical protein